MTDFKEFCHSNSLLMLEIKKILLYAHPEINNHDPQHLYLNAECERIYNAILNSIPEAFLGCFCSHKSAYHQDNGLLSMWRGYGADGGFALVLNSSFLTGKCFQESLNRTGSLALYGKVHYMQDNHSLPEDLNNSLQQFKNFIQRNLDTFLKGTPLDLNHEDFEAVLHLMSLIKHPGFKEEKEFRLCVFEAPNPYLPISQRVYSKLRRGCISYLEFPINLKEALEKIIIGPQEDMLKKVGFLKNYLESKGLLNVDVMVSQIPYLPRL